MTRSKYRHRKRQNEFAILRTMLFFLMLFIVVGSVAYYTQRIVKPIISDIGEMKAKAMVTTLINDVVHSRFADRVNVEQLLVIKTNQEGNIELVQANAQAMNYLASDLTKELQSRYKNMEAELVKVPLGALLGNQLLSETGPYVDLKVMPLNVSKTDFETEFVTQGINQTKYKVYIVLGCQIKVLAPFSDSVVDVEKKVLIAEAVILGRVPDSYVIVPESGVLDAQSL